MYFWWFDCDEKLHHRVESQMKAGDIDWTPRVKTREVVVEHSKQKAEDFGWDPLENLDGVDMRRWKAYSADRLKGTVTDYNQYKELAYRDTELDLIGDTEILNLTEDMWREYETTELPMTDLCMFLTNLSHWMNRKFMQVWGTKLLLCSSVW